MLEETSLPLSHQWLQVEESGVVQQKIETFAPVLASIPVIEDFDVYFHRRHAHQRPLSGSHSPLTMSAERSPLNLSLENNSLRESPLPLNPTPSPPPPLP